MFVSFASFGLAQQVRAEQISIAVLGDSLVHGYGLPFKDGFVPQLQSRLLGDGYQASFINAGVSGDTTAGGLARVDWTLTPDVDGVIVSLGGNDLLRGIDPAFSRRNLQQILEILRRHKLPVLLVGIAAPANYGADYQADFNAIYPTLADEFGALLYPNFLAAIQARPNRNRALRTYMQPDRIHPNAKGVALVVADMAPFVAQLVKRVNERN